MRPVPGGYAARAPAYGVGPPPPMRRLPGALGGAGSRPPASGRLPAPPSGCAGPRPPARRHPSPRARASLRAHSAVCARSRRRKAAAPFMPPPRCGAGCAGPGRAWRRDQARLGLSAAARARSSPPPAPPAKPALRRGGAAAASRQGRAVARPRGWRGLRRCAPGGLRVAHGAALRPGGAVGLPLAARCWGPLRRPAASEEGPLRGPMRRLRGPPGRLGCGPPRAGLQGPRPLAGDRGRGPSERSASPRGRRRRRELRPCGGAAGACAPAAPLKIAGSLRARGRTAHLLRRPPGSS